MGLSDGWAAMVRQMPLDTPEHVQAAWSMVNRPIVIHALEAELLVTDDVSRTLEAARDRIQLAAIDLGMGWFRTPA